MISQDTSHHGTLSLVATPIGNLGDITFRAVETLRASDLIACENTSNAQKLLRHYDITTPTTVYFSQSSLSHTDTIMRVLEGGGHVALISDAGTPTISDPGVLLVQKIINELPVCKIESVPGPSAIITALSLSGFAGNEFVFYGFVPHKKGRETFIKKIVNTEMVAIVYESVHRIEKFLESLATELESAEQSDRKIVVARELTKLHESVVRGTAREAVAYFAEHQDEVRGEFVVIVDRRGI